MVLNVNELAVWSPVGGLCVGGVGVGVCVRVCVYSVWQRFSA